MSVCWTENKNVIMYSTEGGMDIEGGRTYPIKFFKEWIGLLP